VDLPPDARARYFAEHAVDEETRREVAALLEFDSGASSFLLHDIGSAASRALPELEGNPGAAARTDCWRDSRANALRLHVSRQHGIAWQRNLQSHLIPVCRYPHRPVTPLEEFCPRLVRH
jgi:hypothetical protein